MNYLMLIAVFAGFVGIYLSDVLSKSMQPENILLVLPLSLLAFGLMAIDVFKELAPSGKLALPKVAGIRKRALGQVALFALFPAMLPILKFDGATILFIFASSLCLGEKRIVIAAMFSIAFGLSVSTLMNVALPVNVPLWTEALYD
ncbi:hypothetical protein [Leisingera sp.]|uniref:hypothetical protein n=1 Tax=Leisingera sp. TaxID=1879318 RepID=UPI003A8F6C58